MQQQTDLRWCSGCFSEQIVLKLGEPSRGERAHGSAFWWDRDGSLVFANNRCQQCDGEGVVDDAH